MFKVSMSVLAAALLILPPQVVFADEVPQTPAPAGQPANAPAQQALVGRATRRSGGSDRSLSRRALVGSADGLDLPARSGGAERWAAANKGLKGDALKAAVDKQSWDDSVKSLTATPEVLDVMSPNSIGRSSSATPFWRSRRT